jgi:DNA invertase Pin-like site-specific DNA recombinase
MKYVPYFGVSTVSQGKSGLGLSAQRDIVHRFLKAGDELLGEFVKVESGKRVDRPQLAAAISFAKQQGARLLIAKLDRLSRNVSFIFSLRNSEVDFVACDIPDANPLTVGIMAVLAKHERELIGERTRAALQAKKAQGFQLGTPNLRR